MLTGFVFFPQKYKVDNSDVGIHIIQDNSCHCFVAW